ncbi:LysR family transcriptional regulator [Tumebacillus sp. ITR2]|uniref:LysR family transcriptional regulator n=1 Tax=Tumebacillus amylolyticus TaxID=2801339 RepID=A0ABS1JEV5_9BACL|nr:LysR family transcriptional regulator [Tumebacillus amylolyticus]MBL0388093.1 LysR family transcriptional regulator [Tumebacillus amylolyticus]
MESHELRIFRAVAREGSITKAAHTLGYVQSNVTARVRQLEEELNTKLFYRQRGMVLTPAGEKLLGYAERVLHLLDEAQLALNDSIEPMGPLRLGANHTVSALHLPNILAEYNQRYPKVEMSLVTDVSEELVRKILHFQLDGAFVKLAVDHENVVKDLVYEEELVLITQPGDSDLQAVCKQPFLMNTIGCPNRGQLETWLRSIGSAPVRYLEFNHLDAMIQGVISGLGASFVQYSAAQKYVEAGVLRSFPIPSPYSLTQTYFIRHKDSLLTSALEKFLETLKKSQLYSR